MRVAHKHRRATVERMYSPAEAQAMLGIGHTRLYELMSSGKIAPTYLLTRKCRRIPESAIRRYLASRQT